MKKPSPKTKLKAILFDLDGTLVDTEPAAGQAIIRAYRNWGIDVDSSLADIVIGKTWAAAFKELFPRKRPPIPESEAGEQILSEYRKALKTDLLEVNGARDAVRSLAERFKMAVVSGSHRAEIQFALQMLGIENHFEFYLGAEDYPRSKPAPDGYEMAMKRLQVKPQETLIFEDSGPGVLSGRAAGAWVVALSGTNHAGHDTSMAHFQIHDLADVTAEWVKDLEQELSKKDA